MPFPPDTIGANVQKCDIGIAGIPFAERSDECGVFGEVDGIGVIGFNPRNGLPTASWVSAAGLVFKSFATSIKQSFRG